MGGMYYMGWDELGKKMDVRFFLILFFFFLVFFLEFFAI